MSDYTGAELYDIWINSGLSQRKLAKKLDIPFNELHGLIFRHQQTLRPSPNKVDDQEDGNSRTIKSVSSRITSLEDILRECKIDLNEWVIQKHRVNTWEVGAKVSEKHLTWENGKLMTGQIEDPGKLTIETLYQVEVHLVRKSPVELNPLIHPIKVSLGEFPTSERGRIETGKSLILTDMHFGFSRDLVTGQLTPFHDRGVLSIALQIASLNTWDKIVLAGDILDLAEFSEKFARSPEMYWTTQPALIEAAWFIGQLAKVAPNAEIDAMEDNHDERLNRMLLNNMISAYGLKPADDIQGFPVMSVPRLLGLRDLGVNWIGEYPNGKLWLSDNLKVIHGVKVRGNPGGTASAVVRDAEVSTVFGHIHRFEVATRTAHGRYGPRPITAFSPGCMCRIDGVVPAREAEMDWQQGFAVLEYDNDHFWPVLVPVHDGKAIYNGEHYIADDYLQTLRSDTGWNF